MADAITWAYVTIQWLTLTVSYFLAFSLLRNFIRKKTTGTLILFASYIFIAVSGTISALYTTFQAIEQFETGVRIMQSISTVLPQIGLLLIYIFSTRHILRDNEVVKSITLMVASSILGFVFTIYMFGVYNVWNPAITDAWYLLSTNSPTDFLTNISNTVCAIFLVTIQVYINVRIFTRAFILSRRTDKLIRKRGLLMIGWGLVIYITAGLVISMEFAVPWTSNAGPLVFWILRKLLFLTSYIFLYLGWIMPDWFRRRIRGKTWFESRYKEISKFTQ